MMATDCLGKIKKIQFFLFISILASYGSLARFRDMQRMTSLGSRTLLGTSGDISDFQYLTRLLHQYHVTEVCLNDGHLMSPKQWYTALAAVLYKRRSESNPIWTANVLAGVEENGNVFLGSCDLLGTQFQADSIATGYGAHLAQPLLRDAIENAKARNSPLTEQEAFIVIEKCMKVLYYRDARSIDKVKFTNLLVFIIFLFLDSNCKSHKRRCNHLRTLYCRIRLVHCLKLKIKILNKNSIKSTG